MEKRIISWSYWLGIACVFGSFATRVLDLMHVRANLISPKLESVGYHSFLQAAFLFFSTEIAAVIHAWFKSQQAKS
jgi:hypothetical protein